MRWVLTLMISLIWAPLMASCGDSIVDQRYRGVPLFEFEGQLVVEGQFDAGKHAIRLSIFWMPRLDTPMESWLEQPSTSIEVTFPSAFVVKVFEPPAPEHFIGSTGQAFGRLLLYDDLDGDGRRSSEEPIVGEAQNQGVLYVGPERQELATITGLFVEAGFNLIHYPIRCRTRLSQENEADCYVPLGTPCSADADCCGEGGDCERVGGVCLPDAPGGQGLPGGYCAAVNGTTGCRSVEPGSEPPPGFTRGRLVVIDGLGRRGQLHVKGCTSNEDCRESYICEPAYRVCLPDRPVEMAIDPDYALRLICIEDIESI